MSDHNYHGKNPFEHEGLVLGRIHAKANHYKALAYWVGFLKGILSSTKVEMAEYDPLLIEAQNFLKLLQDNDAYDLLEDLKIWKDEPAEIYDIVQNIVDVRSRELSSYEDIDPTKHRVNELYGFCAGIACDNRITPKEVRRLLKKIETYGDIGNDQRIANLRNAAKRSIADGRITPEESDDICKWITHLVGDSATDTGVATYGNVGVWDDAVHDHLDVIFEQRTFVLTGRFTLGPRKVIQEMIVERGGGYKNSVCKKTHYLCIGTSASRDWRHSHEGRKNMRAMELRSAGEGPYLVHEHTLETALRLVL